MRKIAKIFLTVLGIVLSPVLLVIAIAFCVLSDPSMD